MRGIGGNKTGIIQICTVSKNAIGEPVKTWSAVLSLKGFLDLAGGDSKYTSYNAKVQESTHIFISDYVPVDSRIRPEYSRMIIDEKVYDITLIDDPMELHEQIEVYLRFVGGQ